MQKVDAQNWHLSDGSQFESGIETKDTHSGAACAYLKSIAQNPKDFGFISKSISPKEHFGKRLKMSAWVRTALAKGASAQLWLRVDGDWEEKAGCFDNMYKRRIRGTTGWTEHDVEVDVPSASTLIVFGVLLNGSGQVWIDDVLLQTIGTIAVSR
jgi:hypothetical protein